MQPVARHSQQSRICFVRHAESTVNEASKHIREQGGDGALAYHDARYFDAALSSAGQASASEVPRKLQDALSQAGSSELPAKGVRLIVVSPMLRTLETASLGVFPVLPPDTHTQWIALDCIREAMTGEVHKLNGKFIPKSFSDIKPCNIRSPLRDTRTKFPYIDFSQCDEEDPLDPLETIEMMTERVPQFVDWLRVWVDQQQLTHGSNVQLDVVVVSHFVFLHRLFEQLGYPPTASGNCTWTPSFRNSEIRMLPLDAVLAIGSSACAPPAL